MDGDLRLRCVVAYDGSGFHGFAANPGVRTVAGALAEAFEILARRPVEIGCGGRTDAGVHARGQVIHVDVPAELGADPERVRAFLVDRLAPEIVVRDVEITADDFDARRSALRRAYRYTVHNAAAPDPLTANQQWWVADPLDLRALQLSCDAIIGSHDFSSFCRRPKATAGDAAPSLVRRVRDARWEDIGDDRLRFEIVGDAFCHQMVRSIVGTMVDMGRGRRRPGEMTGILAAGDRGAAGTVAPPHGLVLWEIAYP